MAKINIPKRCLTTSKGIIRFRTYDLINEVRRRPILWDKSEKRNRITIDIAWNDLCRIFVPYFDQLNDDEQFFVANYLRGTWKNITSLMIKNYSRKEQGNKKICLYHHTRDLDFYLESRGLNIKDVATERELQELDDLDLKRRAACEHKKSIHEKLKVNTEPPKNIESKKDHSEEKTSTINKSTTPILENGSYDSIELEDYDDDNNSEESNEQYNSIQQVQNIQLKSAKCEAQPHDTDQAFFDSLKPFLRKANESQKLEFKIQVLKLIKKYTKN